MTRDDDYLWDRSGAPDPLVARLEELLSPLRHDPRRARAPARPKPRWSLLLLAAAAALLCGWLLWPMLQGGGPALRLLADGRNVRADEWIETTTRAAALELGDGVGRMHLQPGSRLQLRRIDRDQTRLFLAVGELEAFVAADARPRFFQVETPATNCVDLGCKYVLSVDDGGVTHVRVTLGQVAFESDGGERFIPSGAECMAAEPGRLGTPRFSDVGSRFADLLDEFDRAAGMARRERAEKFCALADDLTHTLSLWHWLADPDAEIRALAEAKLVAMVGAPARRTPAGWKEHLESWWWR